MGELTIRITLEDRNRVLRDFRIVQYHRKVTVEEVVTVESKPVMRKTDFVTFEAAWAHIAEVVQPQR